VSGRRSFLSALAGLVLLAGCCETPRTYTVQFDDQREPMAIVANGYHLQAGACVRFYRECPVYDVATVCGVASVGVMVAR
jgi:hypothetical protein